MGRENRFVKRRPKKTKNELRREKRARRLNWLLDKQCDLAVLKDCK